VKLPPDTDEITSTSSSRERGVASQPVSPAAHGSPVVGFSRNVTAFNWFITPTESAAARVPPPESASTTKTSSEFLAGTAAVAFGIRSKRYPEFRS
jgi:hypothetical protein